MKVITNYSKKPVPSDCMDWSAQLDGAEPGDAVGYGSTEQEAIDDLIDQFEVEQ